MVDESVDLKQLESLALAEQAEDRTFAERQHLIDALERVVPIDWSEALETWDDEVDALLDDMYLERF